VAKLKKKGEGKQGDKMGGDIYEEEESKGEGSDEDLF